MSKVSIVENRSAIQRRDTEAGLQAGADAYLAKPFSPIEPSPDCWPRLAQTERPA